jgi:transcriptional regulator with XRE-family HTH domain
MIPVGEKLRQLRTQKGLSQSELAQHLYFSNRTISNWEKGLRDISVENLKRIADFFNVPIAYFTDLENTIKSQANPFSETGPYKQIELKMLRIRHRYYYLVFLLIGLQILLGFFNFQNRDQWTSVFFIFWTTFTMVSIVQFFLKDKLNTRYYLVKEDKQVQYKTDVSLRIRKKFYCFEILTHPFLIFLEVIFYGSSLLLYAPLHSNEANVLFILTIVISIVIHIVSVIRLLLNKAYGPNLPYQQTRKYHGVMLLRALVTLHYGVIGYHSLSLFFYGITSFPNQLILLNLIMMFLLIITLRMLLRKSVTFFSSYRLNIE